MTCKHNQKECIKNKKIEKIERNRKNVSQRKLLSLLHRIVKKRQDA